MKILSDFWKDKGCYWFFLFFIKFILSSKVRGYNGVNPNKKDNK